MNITYTQKTQRIFNKFFSSFLKDLKEVNDELRKKVKASYKVVDKSSDEYCKLFVENIVPHVQVVNKGEFEGEVAEKYVCKNITIGEVVNAVKDKSEDENKIIMNYLYTLVLFSYMSTLDDENELLNQVLRILGYIETGNTDSFKDEIEDLIDDDIKATLQKVFEFGVRHEPAASGSSSVPNADLFESLGNSKIANIAKEISKDIDVSALRADNPEDMIKNMLDFSSSNNVLGNIIQKVSSTLNSKISNGEIKHDELLGEAMSMMNLFGGDSGGAGGNPFLSNPLFAQMMKGMKSGKTAVRSDVVKKTDARERLRKKLESRKKNVE